VFIVVQEQGYCPDFVHFVMAPLLKDIKRKGKKSNYLNYLNSWKCYIITVAYFNTHNEKELGKE
jgi:hypothetical protein